MGRQTLEGNGCITGRHSKVKCSWRERGTPAQIIGFSGDKAQMRRVPEKDKEVQPNEHRE
jgi:hypothetical protein